MNYGVMNGGKRLRPFLIMELSKFLKIKKSNYMRLALSAEFVHAYSLIHDDLPGMDNDDLRRGKPTNHKKYGEATAILAGNSLLTLAFEILSDVKTHKNPRIRLRLIELLSNLSGNKGLAGGQSLDLLYEKKKVTLKQVIKMHELKTAKLFEFCIIGSLILSGSEHKSRLKDYRRYGKNFGLIFQATDDLLDYVGNKTHTGKGTGKDFKKNKGNILRYKSVGDVKKYCEELAIEATKDNSEFSKNKNPLAAIIFHIIHRIS